MSTDISDVQALWSAVRAAPDDDTLKLVLADYLEENGDAATGYALRWCVGRNRWPRLTKTLAIWCADPSKKHTGKPIEVERAMLPLFFLVIGQNCQRCEQLKEVSFGIAFRKLDWAIEYLGVILAHLRYWAADKET